MPTPDIDNLPEQIEVEDTLSTSEQVPNPTPEQSAEILTSGTENPQPQIEQKITNLVEVLNRLQNLNVETFFAANPTDDSAIAEQRAYFKDGLMIDTEADNIGTAHVKLYAMNTFIGISGLNEVYLLPPSEVANIDLRGKPKLKLYFVETNYLSSSGREIADGQIAGIRLMEYTNESISRATAVSLGEKIRDAFNGFIWNKGKNNLSYSDPQKGYNIQILCESQQDGLDVLTKVLSLQEHEVENKRVKFSDSPAPTEAYPDTQQEVQRLGKTIKTRVKRPICTVKLRAAFLYIDGLIKPEVIYDNSGYYQAPYVTDDL
jgi:hypothetical protein